MENKKYKIYTKGGDLGQTSLIGGKRVLKSHIRIDAYGTLDELNSFIGLLRDKVTIEKDKTTLLKIQNCVFLLESYLASENTEENNLPKFDNSEITFLENQIDEFEKTLEPLSNFIIPGGCELNSIAHICRTICRRTERIVVSLHNTFEVDMFVLQYLNRLSDFFFVYARYLSKTNNKPEIIWNPKK